MKKKLKLLLVVLMPFCALAQIQVQQTNPSNITTIMPFYSSAITQNATLQTFILTPPTQQPTVATPPDGIYDSTYDETDDTTYDYKPILDYGTVINSNLNIGDGNWQDVSGGKVWALKILINNAYNTSIHIDNFSLSPTASFFIVNGDMTLTKGPFTKAGMTGISTFGTFPTDGNSCYLFLFEPNENNIASDTLTISGIVGGYQPIGEVEPPESFNTTGTESLNPTRCIPSIRCYEDWMNSARAVSRWSNGAGSACSGTLLNNENADGVSFYYSAQHCLPGNIARLERAAFQFQFWQTGCNTGTNLNGIEFFGATLLHTVGYNDGDAILLRLNTGPGVGDAPTYAGWNRQNNNPSKNTGGIIHHPRAGDMRFTQPAKIRDFLWDNDFWKVSYYSGTGLVLRGSSGSGLLNANHQVIGNLSRGFPQSCFFRMSGDRFGKFHKGWDGYRQFLSPVNNSFEIGALSLNAITIAGSSTIMGCNSETQQYSVPNLVGCTYTWTVSSNLQIVSGQNSSTISVQHNSLSNETGTLQVVINDSKGSFPNGRQAVFSLNVTLVGTYISGTVTQSGEPVQELFTENYVKANYQTQVDFTSAGCSFTNAELVGGSAGWYFVNYGSAGMLTISLTGGQQATFDLYSTSAACGLQKRTCEFIASSGGYWYKVTPNPATSVLTIMPEKDESDKSNTSRLKTDLEYTVSVLDINTGSLVKQLRVVKGNVTGQISVSNLRRGYYIVQVKEGKNLFATKVLLQ